MSRPYDPRGTTDDPTRGSTGPLREGLWRAEACVEHITVSASACKRAKNAPGIVPCADRNHRANHHVYALLGGARLFGVVDFLVGLQKSIGSRRHRRTTEGGEVHTYGT